MWTKITDQEPPIYKRLLVWVDNDFRKAWFTSEHEFIYWDEEGEPAGYPTHFMIIDHPLHVKPQSVCF